MAITIITATIMITTTIMITAPIITIMCTIVARAPMAPMRRA
ncbi:hypothetical protein X737_22670 [Mesorhizobium sp. L48C026A00]|nr:hypothetical protein X737_22670 [Mesorhizobium sp. L48C026A00]